LNSKFHIFIKERQGKLNWGLLPLQMALARDCSGVCAMLLRRGTFVLCYSADLPAVECMKII